MLMLMNQDQQQQQHQQGGGSNNNNNNGYGAGTQDRQQHEAAMQLQADGSAVSPAAMIQVSQGCLLAPLVTLPLLFRISTTPISNSRVICCLFFRCFLVDDSSV